MAMEEISLEQADPPNGPALAEDLLRKCHQLLSELQNFKAFLSKHKIEHVVDIRQFHNAVRSELKSLERVPWLQYATQMIC